MKTSIRPIKEEDINHIKVVLDSIELFPSDMLDDMVYDYLNNPNSEDLWFTATIDDIPISIGYCAPEKLTEGTFNLYAIGVKKDIQGSGIGSKMMAYIEDQLKEQGHRILIVDTSGTSDFEMTRQFYKNLDYKKEAVIRDFWAEGDDKVVFWKKIY